MGEDDSRVGRTVAIVESIQAETLVGVEPTDWCFAGNRPGRRAATQRTQSFSFEKDFGAVSSRGIEPRPRPSQGRMPPPQPEDVDIRPEPRAPEPVRANSYPKR